MKTLPLAFSAFTIEETISTKSELMTFLDVDSVTFKKITYAPDFVRYKTYSILKRNGGERSIHAPIHDLKKAQQKIAELLNSYYTPRNHVHGYVKNKDILSNANIHTNKRWVAKIDLKNFFESITSNRVFGILKNHPYYFNDLIASTLTRLVTFNNYLPQGAPTSPIISNIICRRLDKDLSDLAVQNHCRYTRYADDITFSTNKKRFPQSIVTYQDDDIRAGNDLLDIVENIHSFPLNTSKTKLIPKHQRQLVTGLIVNKKANLSQSYIKNIRAILFSCETLGIKKAEEKYYQLTLKNYPSHNESYRTPLTTILRGKIEYLGYIKGYSCKPYINFSSRLAELDSSYRPKKGSFQFELFCEGKTDYMYIEAAHNFFKSKGEYKNIQIIYPSNKSKSYGDVNLFAFIDKHAEREQSSTVVGLFDNDNSKVANKLKATDNFGVKDWGNNVYSILIGDDDHKICIEELFDDSVLNIPIDSRRLYRPDEFDKESKIHKTEELVCSSLNSNILDEGVFDFKTKKNVALSKNDFAQSILTNTHPSGEVSFEGFRQIFNAFEEIANLTNP